MGVAVEAGSGAVGAAPHRGAPAAPRPARAPPATAMDPPPPPNPPFAPGDRVRVGGDAATVRYCGALAGKPGAWVGLEWDDEKRGRHGGEAGGARYFAVRASAPTAGSFVREDALRPVAVRSMTLHDALAARYARGDDGRGAVVGGAAVAERQADLGALESASVAGMPVHGPVR